MNTEFKPKNGYEDELALGAYRLMMGVSDEIDVEARGHQSPLLDFNDGSTTNQSSRPLTNQDTLDLLKDLQSVFILSDEPHANDNRVSDDEHDAEQEQKDTVSTLLATEIDILSLLRAASTESELSTTGEEVRRFTLPNCLEFSSIRPVKFELTSSMATDKNKTTPPNDPVIDHAVARAPENPFAQSAGRFKALRDQLNALLIDADFRSHVPESAVLALANLKTQWTVQARQFASYSRTTQYDVDVLKRESLQSLMQLKRELAAQGNLWHRYVRPLLNALISWLAYMESCLGVPNRFQPRLFKATYAEEAFQALQPDDGLREVQDAYSRDMSAAAAVRV